MDAVPDYLRPNHRSRANSTASNASRYVPEGYSGPAASAQQGFQPQPYREDMTPRDVPYLDPTQSVPDNVRHTSRRPSTSSPRSPQHSYRDESYLQPHSRDARPQYARDASVNSVRSRHSHHSQSYEQRPVQDDRRRSYVDRPNYDQRRSYEDRPRDDRRRSYDDRQYDGRRSRDGSRRRDDFDIDHRRDRSREYRPQEYTIRRESDRQSGSRGSYDERRSRNDSYEEPHKRHTRHDSFSPIKRADTHYPTLGGTVMSMWHTFKDALGPRDKY